MNKQGEDVAYQEEKQENTSSMISQCTRLECMCALARSLRAGMSY